MHHLFEQLIYNQSLNKKHTLFSAKHDELNVQGSTVALRRLTVNKVIKYLQSWSFQSNEFGFVKEYQTHKKEKTK